MGAIGPTGPAGPTGPSGAPGAAGSPAPGADPEAVESAPQQETGQDRTEDVSCPTGMLATGGGAEIITDDSSTPKPQLLASQPSGGLASPTTWEVHAWSSNPSAQWRLYVFVVCV